MEEIDYCSRVMKKAFDAFNLNVKKLAISYHNYTFTLLHGKKKIVHGHCRFG
jgi:hypothetical protein